MRLNEDGTGTAVKHRNHLPFRTYIGPVYDGERWVYFFESNDPGFCRMDIETLEVERRQRAPHDFSNHVYGFFRAGKVYAFSASRQLMEYDPAADTWTELGFRAGSNDYQERFEVSPWNDEELIHLKESGELEVVNFVTGNIVCTFQRFPGRVNNIPETLVLAAPDNEFFLLVCFGYCSGPWQVFNSATNTWTQTSWETTRTYTRSAMFDEATGTLYYHINGQQRLTAVQASNAIEPAPAAEELRDAVGEAIFMRVYEQYNQDEARAGKIAGMILEACLLEELGGLLSAGPNAFDTMIAEANELYERMPPQ